MAVGQEEGEKMSDDDLDDDEVYVFDASWQNRKSQSHMPTQKTSSQKCTRYMAHGLLPVKVTCKIGTIVTPSVACIGVRRKLKVILKQLPQDQILFVYKMV